MGRPISLGVLLRGQPTLRQFDILSRADQMFAHLFSDGRGRYYGGPLTEEQIDQLDPEYRARQASNQP